MASLVHQWLRAVASKSDRRLIAACKIPTNNYTPKTAAWCLVTSRRYTNRRKLNQPRWQLAKHVFPSSLFPPPTPISAMNVPFLLVMCRTPPVSGCPTASCCASTTPRTPTTPTHTMPPMPPPPPPVWRPAYLHLPRPLPPASPRRATAGFPGCPRYAHVFPRLSCPRAA